MVDVEWVDNLKVVELKKELKSRGEPTSGRKHELVVRLKEKIKADEEAAEAPKTTPEVEKQETEEPAEAGEPAEDVVMDEAAEVAETVPAGKDGKADEVDASETGKKSKEEVSEAPDEKPAGSEVPKEEVKEPEKEKEQEKEKEPKGAPEAGKQPPEQQKETQPAEEAGKGPEEMMALDGEPEIDDILGEDEMDDMAFELEPTPKGKRRRSQATRSATAEKATSDAHGKAAEKREEKDETEAKEQAHPDKDQMEIDEDDGKPIKDAPEPGGERVAAEVPKEPVSREPAATDAKKRKLDEDVRGATDVVNSGKVESAAKRKRIPIPVPEVKASDAPKAAMQEPALTGSRKSGSLGPSQLEKAPSGVAPTPKQKSRALRINNFVRPFSDKNCKEMLEQYGEVLDMWLPDIKTHCYVIYENEEQAMKAYNGTYNVVWPSGGRALIPRMVTMDEAKQEIEKGRARTNSKSIGAAELQGVANAGYARASGASGMGPDNRMERMPSGPHAASGGLHRRPINRPVTLEDLFCKTHTKPSLYYLPLTDEQIMVKRRHEGKGNIKDVGRGEGGKDNGIGNTNGTLHKDHVRKVEGREEEVQSGGA